jgi:hypothetical protein
MVTKSGFMTPRMEQFFRAMAGVMLQAGWLQLAFLEVEGNRAAAYLNFVYNDQVLVYNSGLDPQKYSYLSPGVVLIARLIEKAIAEKPNTVQLFHNAWFDALKFLAENPDAAGDAIVKWGYNDWSEVKTAADLRAQLKTIAQADLGANAVVMRDPTPLLNRMTIARRVWATAGTQASAERVDTFSIGAKLDLSGVSPNAGDASTLAVLPCRRFAFLPESATLTLESRRVLDDCVVPTLQQSVGLLLKVKGSSAWPGPKGAYTEAQILELAKARAQSVVEYLVTQKVDRARFIVEATLPPESHRETENADIQAEDRFVEMTLVTSGR